MPLLRATRRLRDVLGSRTGQIARSVCWSCRLQSVVRREFTSSSRNSSEKPFYVTTPIFYVNAAPHIGHAHSMIMADVFRRWNELKGKPAIALTGTDEHGLKVQQTALLAGTTPEEICDLNSEKFRSLAGQVMGKHDFIRTTEPRHVNAVQQFWRSLNDKDLIYESTHKGWYSVKDECFHPEDTVERRVDEWTGKPMLVAGGPSGSGNPVEWVEEKNYHFRLSDFKERLLELYRAQPEWIVPTMRMNEVRNWVENHLTDLSISRPRERLSWGIEVPDDPSQTIYVWVDALINYITNAGYPNWTPEAMEAGGWPADLHIVGKDILRFHAIYWPALLMALDLPLPKRLVSHAHWTMNSKKMSKTDGNGVDPQFVIDRLGIDGLRWFMMRRGAITDDATWDNALVAREYRTFLFGQFGNLLNRLLSQTYWDFPSLMEYMKERRGEAEGSVSWPAEPLSQLAGKVDAQMGAARPDKAIELIARAIYGANHTLANAKPWRVFTESGERIEDHVAREQALPVMLCVVEACRIGAILMQPFIPEKAGRALDMLGVDANRRSFEYASLCRDLQYGVPPRPKRADSGLFPQLDVVYFPKNKRHEKNPWDLNYEKWAGKLEEKQTQRGRHRDGEDNLEMRTIED